MSYNINHRAPSHPYRPDPRRSFARCAACGLKRSLCQQAQITPMSFRTPDEQTIDERAAFLAFEIHEDRLAPEKEIADAIRTEIRRFLK